MEEKPDTAHERKSKDAAVGCLVIIILSIIFAFWASSL